MNHTLHKWVGVALALTLLLAACGGASSTAAPASAAPAVAASSAAQSSESAAARTELIAAIGSEPSAGWDPLTGYAVKFDPQLQSTLTKTDNGKVVNDLATDYEVTDSGRTWTFHIRDDVLFCNGDKLTASDVAFTYNSMKTAGTNLDLSNMIEAVAPDDTTVVFRLVEPDYTFLYGTHKVGIVPEKLYDENYGDHPIGSGPYKLVQWDKGQQAVWEYNELYYGAEPAIKRIVLVFMDEDAAFAAVRKGTVDIAYTNQSLAMQTVDGYRMVNVETIDNFGIIFPCQPDEGKTTEAGKKIGNNVTCDAAIRRAIGVGIDRQKLLKDVFNGYGYPSYSMCDTMPWFNEETALTSENSGVDVACKILEDAGWVDTDGDGIREKDGLKAEFTLNYTATMGNRQSVAMAVAEQAKALGIEIHPNGAANSDIQQVFHCEPYVFGRGDHTPNEFYLMTSSTTPGSGWSNSGYYSNPKVDEYFRLARECENLDDLYRYFKLAQWDGETGASLLGDAPDVWLIRADHCYFVREGLDIGKQQIHPHSAQLSVLANILEWKWN